MTTATIASGAALELNFKGTASFSSCEKLAKWLREQLERSDPSWLTPMLATLRKSRMVDPGVQTVDQLKGVISQVTGRLEQYVEGERTPRERTALRRFCRKLSEEYQQNARPLRRPLSTGV